MGESLLPGPRVGDPNLDPIMEQPLWIGKGLYLQLHSTTPEENRAGCLPREHQIPLCPEARASAGGLVVGGALRQPSPQPLQPLPAITKITTEVN